MNPLCSCTPIVIGPPSLCDNNCIYAPNMLVNTVTACASETAINISPIVTKCGDTPVKYSIISYKNVTGVPTINSEQIIFTPANNNYAAGEIVYRVSCGILSKTGKIIIVYLNKCLDVNCTQTQICNKCTGLCEPLPGDLSIGKTAISFNKNNGLKLG